MRPQLILCAFLAAACGAGPAGDLTGASSTGGSGGQAVSSSSSGEGTGGGDADAGADDGTPTRVACTSSFGNALNTAFGRLDGYLVAIVPPGQHSCNGDTDHVHLQVKMQGAVYDVAVNTDVLIAEQDTPVPDFTWSEGWHTGIGLDYTKAFGAHSGAFASTSPAALAQQLETELAAVNHISVFATGYGPDGAHDVHRQGSNHDGAIVLDPLSAKPHVLLFCFSTQSF